MAQRASYLLALVLAATLSACGLGRDSGGDGGAISDPIVAATVNGRPIYIEDVRAHAVARGMLQEGEDLDANSDAANLALEELIQVRLFALEAEARGLDRDPHVRRQLENARDQVLANAIYEQIDERSLDPETIERLYRDNASQLGRGDEIRLRHIQFPTREGADAAKRRLEAGERFEALAFELSTERNSAPDGGDLGFRSLADLTPTMRQAVDRASVSELIGPIQLNDGWHLFRIEDRRTIGGPSLEELRPRIVNWLRFREISQLQERLEADARIERLRAPEQSMAPAGETSAPADAEEPEQPFRPDAAAPPGQAPPQFPFTMGPGGLTGSPAAPAPAAPAQQAPPAPEPAAPPAQ